MRGRACWAAAFVVVLINLNCATALEQDPTPERPKVGCILATQKQQSQVSGRLMPEKVIVIGITSAEDGERWKVLRGPDFALDDWQPHDREAIHFGARCESGSAFMRADPVHMKVPTVITSQ